MFYKKHLILALACLTVSACANPQKEIELNGQYWQRKNASSALWTRGPKAQHLLHQDMARCTTELIELERLGSIRNAIPADNNGRTTIPPDPRTPEGHMAQWDTPERDGYLYAEHADYHDFETCMTFKGWERVEHLPYDTAVRARDNYLDTIVYQGHRSKYGDTYNASPESPAYKHLNE